MTKPKKTWGRMTRLEQVRVGRRLVALSAILATGAGPHSKRDARKTRNAPQLTDW